MSNDSYSNEVRKIEQLASSIQSILHREEQLEEENRSLKELLTDLVPSYDENGNDYNESRRDAVISEIEKKQEEITELGREKQHYEKEARQLSSSYRQKCEEIKLKQGNHMGVSKSLNLSGKRFGATTAAFGVAIAFQRSQYYNDQSRIFENLSRAALAAASGTLIHVSTNILDKGDFTVPSQGNKYSNYDSEGKRSDTKTRNSTVNNRSHSLNQSLLRSLGLNSKPGTNTLDSSMVSLASVHMICSNEVYSIADADAMLASQWETNIDYIVQYRKENNLQWIGKEQGCAELVPGNIVEEYKFPQIAAASGPKDALMAYMCVHNYGKADYDTYSQDPEWQHLHRRAFPESYNKNAKKVKERRDSIQSELQGRGICYGEMNHYVASSPFDNGRYFVAGGNQHMSFLKFEKNWYRDYQKDVSFQSKNEVIDSSLIEGIEVNKNDLKEPSKFWGQHDTNRTMETYVEIARDIPIVQECLRNGHSLDSIMKDPNLGICATMYYRDPIEVYEVGDKDFFVFASDGRHRVLAAQELGYKIPVRVSTRYIPRQY